MEGRELERRIRLGRLLDFYGPLLTGHRLETVRLYCEEDLSLQEIASYLTEKGSPVTRQGVYDAVTKAEKQLTEYEEKLGLLSRYDRVAEAARDGLTALDEGDLEKARGILETMTEL